MVGSGEAMILANHCERHYLSIAVLLDALGQYVAPMKDDAPPETSTVVRPLAFPAKVGRRNSSNVTSVFNDADQAI